MLFSLPCHNNGYKSVVEGCACFYLLLEHFLQLEAMCALVEAVNTEHVTYAGHLRSGRAAKCIARSARKV